MEAAFSSQQKQQAASEELPLFPQEEWYEQLLRYGLYIGAAFQIICILAVIFDVSPSKKPASADGLGDEDSAASSTDEEDSEDEAYQQSKRSRRQRLERSKKRR